MDFAFYYEQICKFKPISREDEQELFKEYYTEGTKTFRKKIIRDKIVNSNLRFAFKRAKHYAKSDVNQFEELISAANEGLLVGFDKYDPDSGFRFLTYAGWWVRQRILKEMSKFRIVALPIMKQQLATKIHRFVEMQDSTPSLGELFEAFPDNSEKDIVELYQTRYLTYFFEDMNEDEELDDPIIEALEADIDDERLNLVIESLPAHKRIIVSLFFGLDDGQERSVTEIARVLSIPRKDMKELQEETLLELKERLLEFKGEPEDSPRG